MSVEHYSRPDSIDIPRSFKCKGRFYRFTDEQWEEIVGSVNAPKNVEIVTLMRGSKTYIKVNEMANQIVKNKKSTH